MCIFRIVHNLYDAPRDLSACIHSLWHLYGVKTPGAVQIRTAGVRKCRFLQSAPFGVVYCHVHFWNRTLPVRGTMGPPSLRTKFVASVRYENSWSRTHPYSGRTKIPFVSEFSLAVVYCHARFRNRTPAIRGAAGPPSLCTQPVLTVWCLNSGSCTHPYNGCTKMPFARECSPSVGQVPCAFTES